MIKKISLVFVLALSLLTLTDKSVHAYEQARPATAGRVQQARPALPSTIEEVQRCETYNQISTYSSYQTTTTYSKCYIKKTRYIRTYRGEIQAVVSYYWSYPKRIKSNTVHFETKYFQNNENKNQRINQSFQIYSNFEKTHGSYNYNINNRSRNSSSSFSFTLHF